MTKYDEATCLHDVIRNLCKMQADVMNDNGRCAQVHEGANALGKAIAGTAVYVKACALSKSKPAGEMAEFIGEVTPTAAKAK